MKLHGKNIYVSALEKEHCRELYRINEYDVDTETDSPLGYAISSADEWFEEMQKSQHKSHLRLGVFKPNGEIIGDVAVQNIDWRNRHASLGLGIAKVSDRHRGYGYEAMQLIIHHAFNHLGLNRLMAETSSKNQPAQKLLIKLGFNHEGTLRKKIYADGIFYDGLVYGLLKEEYKK